MLVSGRVVLMFGNFSPQQPASFRSLARAGQQPLCHEAFQTMGKEKNPVLLMEEIMHQYGEYPI